MRGPWLSGQFGKEIKEALAFLMELPADHEYFRDVLQEVLIDRNLSANDVEHLDPEFLQKQILQSPAFLRTVVWVIALNVVKAKTTAEAHGLFFFAFLLS